MPGAINVDIVAGQGVRASATKLPFAPGSVDQIIVSNPYFVGFEREAQSIMHWLPESASALKPGGQIIINATVNNRFAQLPSASVLDSLGLRVVQQPGPLLPQFQNQAFTFTSGKPLPTVNMGTTILERVR
ncbi:hypothetical protein FACS189497_11420 [Betaproteobacteria bacterium]|nr:hypothetical protein FACS189497_11420 [Betaproteobacteria bacterium]